MQLGSLFIIDDEH